MSLRLSIGLGFVLAAFATAPAISQGCNVLSVWKPQEERVPIYSVARIFKDEAGTAPQGAATVIDKRRRLILTASHVAAGDTVWFRFPGFDSPMLQGKVVLRIPAADGDDEDTGQAWGKARDIAIIRAVQPLPALARPLDLRVLVNENETLTFYGFPTAAKTAVFGTGKAGTPSPISAVSALSESEISCTRLIREITQNGDSGSAIVANSAYVIGITSKSIQNDHQNLFIPTGCFFDRIVETADPVGANETYTLFTTGSPRAIAAWLADDPSQISNIDIYLAVARMLKDGVGTEMLRCPIMPMASARGIPLEGLLLFANSKGQKTAVADGLVTDYLLNGKSRDSRVALASLTSARNLLAAAISETAGNQAPTSIDDVKSKFEASDAVLFKSLSDTSLLLGRLSGVEQSQYFTDAKVAAAWSVALSASPALRGAAYASLGQAMQRSDDPELAVRAFTSAQSEGFTPGWVLKRKTTLLVDTNLPRSIASTKLADNEITQILSSNDANIFAEISPPQ